MLVLLVGLAAGAPGPPALSAEELRGLSAGEVMQRTQPDGSVLAIADMPGPAACTFGQVMDLEARGPEVDSIRSVSLYERDAAGFGARWDMGAAGYSLVFHARYSLQVSQQYATFTLDKARDNGLGVSEGSFQVLSTAGGSRVLIRSRSEPDMPLPQWLWNKLGESTTEQIMLGIRGRVKRLC